MTTETQAHVNKLFRIATQSQVARELRTDTDWKQFQAIAEEGAARIEAELEDYRLNYQTRLADARQIILRETTGHVLEPPKPPGAAHISDRDVLDQRADQRVRLDHTRRLSAINTDEMDQYRAFRDAVLARDAKQGQARTAFNRTQMRSGPTRQR